MAHSLERFPLQTKQSLISQALESERLVDMYTYISFSTAELFDKVWETPVLQLAQEIGVSDAALGKACRKAGIPLPGRGHWAKQANIRPQKPKLPKNNGTVEFKVLDRSAIPRPSPKPVKTEQTIQVPDLLKEPHPLVIQWLKVARSAKIIDGFLGTRGRRVLDIKTSAASIDRCARFFDTLIKAAEREGYSWKITGANTTSVIVNNEAVAVRLVERVKRLPSPPQPPQARRPGGAWTPDFSRMVNPRYEWIPTGELAFQIDEYTDYGERKNWKDTKTGLVETKIADILVGLARTSVLLKKKREEREIQAREYAAAEAVRLERVRKAEIQHRLQLKLINYTEKWEQAERLRSFIAVVAKRVECAQAVDPTAAKAWLEWAHQQANLLDPTERDLTTVISLEVQLENGLNSSSYRKPEKSWWSE